MSDYAIASRDLGDDGDAKGCVDRALNIAMLTHSINPRGGVVHALNLAEALTREGHRVTLLAPARRGQRLFRDAACELELVPLERDGVDLVDRVEARVDAYLSHLSTRPSAHPFAHLSGQFSKTGGNEASPRFDILHAQDSISGNALATLAALGKIAGFLRTVHHLDTFADPRLTAYQLRAFTTARRVLCVSATWQDHLREAYGIDAVRVNNGVDTIRYRAASKHVSSLRTDTASDSDGAVARHHGLKPGALFMAVGGVEERKNTLRLLEAFIQVRRTRPDAQLAIVGGASLLDHDDYTRAFVALAARHGLAHEASPVANADDGAALRVLGPVRDADMPALFRLADVLVMPSLREGFGLVTLEALASGTPVVASRIAPFTEYLGETDCCFADPLASSSIAAAMLAALGRPVDAEALCARFSWNASARRHVEVYRQTIMAARWAPSPASSASAHPTSPELI